MREQLEKLVEKAKALSEPITKDSRHVAECAVHKQYANELESLLRAEQAQPSLQERIAQLTAHRAGHNERADEIGGYCVVCGIPWPCAYAGKPPAEQAQVPPADPLKLNCMDCGLPYSEQGLDTTLPDDQWRMIHYSEGGLLCGRCIARRADKLPHAVAIRARIEFASQAPVSEPPVQHNHALDKFPHRAVVCPACNIARARATQTPAAADQQGELRERLAAVAVQKAQIISFPDSSIIDLVATVHSVLDSILPLIQRDRDAAVAKLNQWIDQRANNEPGIEKVEISTELPLEARINVLVQIIASHRLRAAVAAALEQAAQLVHVSGLIEGAISPKYECRYCFAPCRDDKNLLHTKSCIVTQIRSLITQPQADALAAERNRARLEEAEWWNTERLRGRPQPICLCRDTDRCPRCKRLATLRAAVDNNQKG